MLPYFRHGSEGCHPRQVTAWELARIMLLLMRGSLSWMAAFAAMTGWGRSANCLGRALSASVPSPRLGEGTLG